MSKRVGGLLVFLGFLLILAILWWSGVFASSSQTTLVQNQTTVPLKTQSREEDIPRVSIITENLEVPWAIAFLPEGGMFVTERPGRVRFIDSSGKLQDRPVATIKEATPIGEGGLLGIALHPEFASNHFVYLYYTYEASGSNTRNRVVRYTFENNILNSPETIVDAIPGASNHNGGRIAFGPDGYLYITTGDAQEPSLAQTTSSLAGKILRVTDSGSSAPGNPFGNQVYSYGHRNPQGIAWDNSRQLFETEHGRSGIQSGLDEVNLVAQGQNYGWPEIQGNETRNGMVTPLRNSGATNTWAPASAAFYGDSLFFGGLAGQTLYEAVIQEGSVVDFKEHFNKEFGRIREVILGPDNMLYITTSNRDGRGLSQQGDDKILRINPERL